MPKEPPPQPKWRKAAELSSLALMLPSSIAVGLFFGYHLDKLLHTRPWMLLIFFLLGIASGFISLFRGIRKLSPPP
jgi:F0F1-type ATP synthase assembly protein I